MEWEVTRAYIMCEPIIKGSTKEAQLMTTEWVSEKGRYTERKREKYQEKKRDR